MSGTTMPIFGKNARVSMAVATMLVIAFATAIVGATPASAAGKTEFSDVPASAKFYTEISWLADQQVTTGYSDGTFHPTESVSREAFAAFLYRLAGKPSVSLPSKPPFEDVKTSAQFYKEIVWLSKKGITTGWSDGTFRPRDKITREAIAAFLYRFEGKPSFKTPKRSPFKDMTTRSNFFKEVTWLAKTGVTTGYSNGTFRPKINVSREAVAAFLYRVDAITVDWNEQAASPSSSPSATEISKEDAAAQYLAIATRYNAYSEGAWAAAWDEIEPDPEAWKPLVPAAAGFVVVSRTFVDELIAAEWPENVQSTVDEIVSGASKEILWFQAISEAESLDEIKAAFYSLPEDVGRGASQELRVRLGMDNIGEDD